VDWKLKQGARDPVPGVELPERPNAHCMDQLLQAAGPDDLVAHRDIRDRNGLLLWAKGRPITPDIRERLIAKRLLEPLEASLTYRNSLAPADLERVARQVLDEERALAALLGEDGGRILALFRHLRLHGGPGVLMTATARNRPAALRHSVSVAMIAAWLALRLQCSDSLVADAAEAGLMHDVGENYLDPALLSQSRQLDAAQWRSICVHPLVGAALLREAGTYPERVAMAVQEHHERADGSGYPAATAEISPLGRILLSAEMMAALLSAGDDPLARVAIALRMIPGQFPREVIDVVSARQREHAPTPSAPPDAARLGDYLAQVLGALRQARQELMALGDRAGDDAERALVAHLSGLVLRFTSAMSSAGASAPMDCRLLLEDPGIARELCQVMREMSWQLPGLHRHAELLVYQRAGDAAAWQPLLRALDLRIDVDCASCLAA